MEDSDFDHLLDVLYGSCRQASEWQYFGELLQRCIGGSAPEVSLFSPNSGEIQAFSIPFLSESQSQTYLSETIQYNPRIPRVTSCPDKFHVYSDHLAFNINELKVHPFIEWTREEIGLQFIAGSCFTLESGLIFALMIHRSSKEGIIDDSGLALLSRLYPHIRRAAVLTEVLGREKIKSHLFSTYLENASFGVIYLDSLGRLSERNSLALRYIEQSPEITLEIDGKLAPTKSATKQTVRFVKNIRLLARGVHSHSSSTSISSGSKTKPLTVHAVPVKSSWSEEVFTSFIPTVVVYIFDTGFKLSLSGMQRVCAHLGLTQRESEIAELLYYGMQPKQISTQLHIAENTVRVFIRHIHQKTGVKRQSELVKLLSELNSLWPS